MSRSCDLRRTPTYMSPEQLNSRSGPEKGYLGTAVDVWASGVWLTVMLVRHLFAPYAVGVPMNSAVSEA